MNEKITERAGAAGYWHVAEQAGWRRRDAVALLESAGVVVAMTGSTADPVAVALAWLGYPDVMRNERTAHCAGGPQ